MADAFWFVFLSNGDQIYEIFKEMVAQAKSPVFSRKNKASSQIGHEITFIEMVSRCYWGGNRAVQAV
jgi:hypothetical protein